MADGQLSFVSFVRRGLATAFTAEDNSTPGPETTISVVSNVKSNTGTLEATTDLSLIGPGDIVGLDPSVIVRLSPKPDDFDAEYIPYALIEFDQADLPWRYTPAKAAGDRLRPWLSLVVVPTSEGKLDPPTPAQKLAVLTTTAASLPTPQQLWAFGHTQFEGANLSDQQMKDRMQGDPGMFVARIVSARLLKPNTEYVACLVPTFERGRKIGLGEQPGDIDALAPWDTSDPRLPVYFSWRFATGSAGSFEQLARLIKAAVFPDTLGRRDMDVTTPGLVDLPASQSSLPVEGALQSVAAFDAGRPEWNATEQQVFVNALKEFVNAPTEAEVPLLAPPLYGQWYAADDELTAPRPAAGATNPPWFYELNSDPRDRVHAALGTTVIQNEQQALLAAGWDQVDEIRTINEKLRVLQLGRGLITRIYVRHVKDASLQRFFNLTRQTHARIICGNTTVCENVGASPIIPGFMSAQFARWARPRGHIGRRQGRPGFSGFVPNLINLLNGCRVPAPEPPPPPGIHTPEGGLPGGISCERIDEFIVLGQEVLLRWGLIILWVARKLLVTQSGDCWWIGLKALRFAIGLIYIAISGNDARLRCKWSAGTLTPQDILTATPRPGFQGVARVPDPLPLPTTPGVPVGQPDSPDAAAIRQALSVLLQRVADPPRLQCPPSMDLGACRVSLVDALHPDLTVGQRILDRLDIDASVDWNPLDVLEPIYAPPEFEQPMYEPLAKVSHDWLLPGLNTIERDTVGLAVVNQRFIEAYMTGLNHEMTRELLWNEFPTDQRGTYFRQFWDIAGHILEDGSTLPPEQLRDVKPLRLWSKLAHLGDNSPRPAPVPPPLPGQEAEPYLVLVVRAQLIQKYPNVIVYAQKLDPVTHKLTGEQEHPVFYALLKPDTAFYGFRLTASSVRNDPRWYFVLEEQPGEPKFAEEGANLNTQTFTDPAQFFVRDDVTNDPVQTAAQSASEFAHKTFLLPFRLGVQATTMLPDP